ncbi:MAG: sugar nucleotide-binding protein [Limisphaerales bacterium]
MKLAWITGANGLIGNYLIQTAPRFAQGSRVRALTRDQFNLLDFAAVRREFQKDQPQLVIHCAAITTISEAQKNPVLAQRVNVELTQLLAELAAEVQFVFFSTDLVFDGLKGNYAEPDAVNPLHLYGETKAAAEQIVLKNPRHTVVRTSINGGTSLSGNRGFNEVMRQAWQSGQGMNLFTDEFRCRFQRWKQHARSGNWAEKKVRGNLSRRRRGKIIALADWPNARRALALLHPKITADSPQEFFRPAALAGRFP